MKNGDSLQDRFQQLLQLLEKAAVKAGKKLQDIEFVGVTKTHTSSTIREALQCGLRHLGENKVQEARSKIEDIGNQGIWHMIGHLQKNKAREAARLFDRIDSVDSLELAQELSKHAKEAGKMLPILLQVNVVGERSKFGIAPNVAASAAEAMNGLPGLQLNGLMTLAPYFDEAEKARPAFAGLRSCRDEITKATGLHLPVLSMGMSHDFEIAVEEGSTSVRIGTALFGARQTLAKKREEAE